MKHLTQEGGRLNDELVIGILGASGFIGLQLMSILAAHPYVKTIIPISRTYKNKTVASAFPALKHLSDIRFAESEQLLKPVDVYISALPHKESFEYLKLICQTGKPYIDLSGDFRVSSFEKYKELYGLTHPLPGMLSDFSRIVPELEEEAAMQSQYISLQGCNSTAVILALYPLLKEGVVEKNHWINVDLKVGSSGSGGKEMHQSQAHFHRAQGVRPHKLLGKHRHTVEINDYFKCNHNIDTDVLINTFSVDMVRGISAACYLLLDKKLKRNEIIAMYRKHYGEKVCIRLMINKMGFDRYPNPKNVSGTNFCDIGFEYDENSGRFIVISALDNLIKGGAGQAVQVLNKLFNIEEAAGLPLMVTYP